MNKREEQIYAFIDSQNINLGVKHDIKDENGKLLYSGWPLDYRKLRLYLQNKYSVTRAYLFIGNVPGNETLYSDLQRWGYEVILKPTLPYREDGIKKQKGNVDAELVLYASALLYKQYDKAIIMSGDGDFLCLAEFLDAQNKLAKILTPNFRYSRLLNKFASRVTTIGNLKGQLGKVDKSK